MNQEKSRNFEPPVSRALFHGENIAQCAPRTIRVNSNETKIQKSELQHSSLSIRTCKRCLAPSGALILKTQIKYFKFERAIKPAASSIFWQFETWKEFKNFKSKYRRKHDEN